MNRVPALALDAHRTEAEEALASIRAEMDALPRPMRAWGRFGSFRQRA